MIKATRHVGIVVTDLQRSLAFYEKFLGLTVWRKDTEEGPYIDAVVGIKNAKIEWVKLKTIDNFVVELLQYHSHPDTQHNASIISSNKTGCSHIAFTVKDCLQLYRDLINNNYLCNAAPQLAPNGSAKVMYCHDPDGTILELVEEVSNHEKLS